jgi:hypothetical protein
VATAAPCPGHQLAGNEQRVTQKGVSGLGTRQAANSLPNTLAVDSPGPASSLAARWGQRSPAILLTMSGMSWNPLLHSMPSQYGALDHARGLMPNTTKLRTVDVLCITQAC